MKQEKQDFKKQGLLSKYRIEKVNGNPLSKGSKYFVLRYDNGGSDMIHIRACQKALLVYAEEVRDHIPKLSLELKERIRQIQNSESECLHDWQSPYDDGHRECSKCGEINLFR